MRVTLERLNLPEEIVVTLAEIRQHLREFGNVTSNDAQYEALLAAAREWIEDYTGRALIDQQWRQTVTPEGWQEAGSTATAQWQSGEIVLRRSPVLTVDSVKSIATDGTLTTVDSATYEVRGANSKWPRLCLLSGTWAGAYRIDFRAGFVDQVGSPPVGEVPERFKQAMKLFVEAHYDRDEKMMQKLLDAATLIIKAERADVGIA